MPRRRFSMPAPAQGGFGLIVVDVDVDVDAFLLPDSLSVARVNAHARKTSGKMTGKFHTKNAQAARNSSGRMNPVL